MDTKTDRELIELAAKAAGMSNFTEWTDSVDDYDSLLHAEPALHPKGIGQQACAWNPLIDDGDALRLAVQLGLTVDNPHQYNVASTTMETKCSYCGGDYKETFVEISSCTFSAVRRAIVMAAAKIGEGME